MISYLDNASTTPLRPEALAAMLPYLTERYGNPSGSHRVARQARGAIEEAREHMSVVLGCLPEEIVFTAGGTEAANLAIVGGAGGRGVVCSTVEHHCVIRSCERLGGTKVRVDGEGVVDLEALADALSPAVGLVSIMVANNEVGSIQPLDEIAALVRDRAPTALLHTDAVAAVGCLDLAVTAAAADLVSVSAHKFGGPKGVGALVVRGDTTLVPQLVGGEQERARRAGTHDVAGIVGMAAALDATASRRTEETSRIRSLRDRLASGVLGCTPGAIETGPPRDAGAKIDSIFHVLVEGVDSEELLYLLDEEGVCASSGSACASGASEASHVLLAMGFTEREARSAIRFSLGFLTTEEEIDHTLDVMPKLVAHLRSYAS